MRSCLKEKVKRICETKNVMLEHMYHKPVIKRKRNFLQPCMSTGIWLLRMSGMSPYSSIRQSKTERRILLEGQLGTLKDPDHGIYPMVTSSSTLAAYGAIGAGIPPYEIKKIVTVCKAYSSAVGAGAFVSEIFGDEADELRRRGGDGGEFGATTGRPRRMGWFDCVASKYGCRMQGATDVAFTVLDVLGYLDEIPVCVGYEIDGEVTTDFPVTAKLEKAKPVLKKLPGWKCDIRGIKKYEDLPENCRKVCRVCGGADRISNHDGIKRTWAERILSTAASRMTHMIKNVIFDVGQVLVAWEPVEAMRALGMDEETVRAVADATVHTSDWDEADRGALSDEELLTGFIRKAPAYEAQIRNFSGACEPGDLSVSVCRGMDADVKGQGVSPVYPFQLRCLDIREDEGSVAWLP